MQPDEIVRQANPTGNHQKIRAVSIWTGRNYPAPRPPISSGAQRSRAQSCRGETAAVKPGTSLVSLLQKYAPGRAIGPETTIEELGLSSLDRVEFMMDLEAKLDTSIDESAFASVSRVADLTKPMVAPEQTAFPRYNRSWLAKCFGASFWSAFSSR